jgi:hypothetical protein
MKALPKRMIRRRKKAPADGTFFKKEGQEPGFFSEAAHDTFFQPSAAAVQRKCADCEKEEKAQRMPDKKEEDKNTSIPYRVMAARCPTARSNFLVSAWGTILAP